MKARPDNFVDELQKDHQRLSDLAASFQNAVSASNRKTARVILGEIDNAAKAHFEFEENYLYPRILRLTRQIAEKLSTERRAINEFIAMAGGSLRQGRPCENRLSDLSGLLLKHLKDCSDLVLLADKFGADEKSELRRKFKECCVVKR